MSKAQWIKDNLKPGELYAGLLLGKGDTPDQHIILLPGEVEGLTQPKCIQWAKKIGGDLPIRREQSLLFANLKEEFQPRWYWSGEPHASDSDYAWNQNFTNGYQGDGIKSAEGRARAVRRLSAI